MTHEEVMHQVREKMTLLASRCYSQELSACSAHPIFQPQKFINQVLAIPEFLTKDPDQSLPMICYDHRHMIYKEIRKYIYEMFKAGWVKVIPKES